MGKTGNLDQHRKNAGKSPCINLHKLDELLEDLRRHKLEDVLRQLEQHGEEELGSECPQQREDDVDSGLVLAFGRCLLIATRDGLSPHVPRW